MFILCVANPKYGSTIRAVARSSNSHSSIDVKPCELFTLDVSVLDSRISLVEFLILLSLPPARCGGLSFVLRVIFTNSERERLNHFPDERLIVRKDDEMRYK